MNTQQGVRLKANRCIILEVLVDSMDSAEAAASGGAERIVVCSNARHGGSTPSLGLVKSIIENPIVKSFNVALYVLLRVRGNDVCYKPSDLHVIDEDIVLFKNLNVDGFAFGAINSLGRVDQAACRRVIDQSHPCPVLFTQAFHISNDESEALETVIGLNFKGIWLKPLQDMKAYKAYIEKIVQQVDQRVEVIPYATCDNYKHILEVAGIKVISGHLANRKEVKFEGMAVLKAEDKEYYVVDFDDVRAIVENMKERNAHNMN